MTKTTLTATIMMQCCTLLYNALMNSNIKYVSLDKSIHKNALASAQVLHINDIHTLSLQYNNT